MLRHPDVGCNSRRSDRAAYRLSLPCIIVQMYKNCTVLAQTNRVLRLTARLIFAIMRRAFGPVLFVTTVLRF